MAIFILKERATSRSMVVSLHVLRPHRGGRERWRRRDNGLA